MIRAALGLAPAQEQAFAREFETWWTGRERGTTLCRGRARSTKRRGARRLREGGRRTALADAAQQSRPCSARRLCTRLSPRTRRARGLGHLRGRGRRLGSALVPLASAIALAHAGAVPPRGIGSTSAVGRYATGASLAAVRHPDLRLRRLRQQFKLLAIQTERAQITKAPGFVRGREVRSGSGVQPRRGCRDPAHACARSRRRRRVTGRYSGLACSAQGHALKTPTTRGGRTLSEPQKPALV